MDAIELKDILQGASTLILALSMFIFRDFKGSIDSVKDSIAELNLSIAQLLTSDKHKDSRLDAHSLRIEKALAENAELRSKIHQLRNDFQIQIGKLENRKADK